VARYASGLIHSGDSQIARSSSSSRYESRHYCERQPADRRRLEAIVTDRNAPQKHVWRANIILATADGCGTAEIMRRSGKSKPAESSGDRVLMNPITGIAAWYFRTSTVDWL
jgi:hypothetical protein